MVAELNKVSSSVLARQVTGHMVVVMSQIQLQTMGKKHALAAGAAAHAPPVAQITRVSAISLQINEKGCTAFLNVSFMSHTSAPRFVSGLARAF